MAHLQLRGGLNAPPVILPFSLTLATVLPLSKAAPSLALLAEYRALRRARLRAHRARNLRRLRRGWAELAQAGFGEESGAFVEARDLRGLTVIRLRGRGADALGSERVLAKF